MIANILVGVVLGYLIFNIGKVLLSKVYRKDDENQEDSRYYKSSLILNTRENTLKKRIKLAKANRNNKKHL